MSDFTHNGTQFKAVERKHKPTKWGAVRYYDVTKLNKNEKWPGENGELPPGAFLQAMVSRPGEVVRHGTYQVQFENGVRRYRVECEVSFI